MKFIDIETLKVKESFNTGSLATQCFDSNTRLIVSGHEDSSLRLWDRKSGKPCGFLASHLMFTSCVKMHPQSENLLISGSHDGYLSRKDDSYSCASS